MRILAIDPGVTSGYCLANFVTIEMERNDPGGEFITLEPFQMLDDVDIIWDRLEAIKPRYVVCEDFEFRNNARAGLVLFSVQAIGVVRLYEIKAPHQCAVILQNAAQGKGYYSNNLLKQMGVYKRGLPHAMDATRHLLHWLTFGSGYQYVQGKDINKMVKLV